MKNNADKTEITQSLIQRLLTKQMTSSNYRKLNELKTAQGRRLNNFGKEESSKKENK